MPKPKRWKILVVWADGSEEYVAQGDHDAIFTNRASAESAAQLARMGIDGAQSVTVVQA